MNEDVYHVTNPASRETALVQARGRRAYRRRAGGLCKCGEERAGPTQGYCKACHAAAQARYRARQKAKLAELMQKLAQSEART